MISYIFTEQFEKNIFLREKKERVYIQEKDSEEDRLVYLIREGT